MSTVIHAFLAEVLHRKLASAHSFEAPRLIWFPDDDRLALLSPTALTMVTVILCLDCLPPLQTFARWLTPLSEQTHQHQPVLSRFRIFSIVPLYNIWKPLLPLIDSCCRHITQYTTYFHLPYVVVSFQRSSRPFEHLKSSHSRCLAILSAFSHKILPSGKTLFDDTRQNQSWRTSNNLFHGNLWHFLSEALWASYNSTILSLFLSIEEIWVSLQL